MLKRYVIGICGSIREPLIYIYVVNSVHYTFLMNYIGFLTVTYVGSQTDKLLLLLRPSLFPLCIISFETIGGAYEYAYAYLS